MFRAIFCPSSGAYDCDLQLLVLCPSVVVGWVRRAATWHCVYGMMHGQTHIKSITYSECASCNFRYPACNAHAPHVAFAAVQCLFHADGQTDRHTDEGNIRFSQFCERALKMHGTVLTISKASQLIGAQFSNTALSFFSSTSTRSGMSCQTLEVN